MTRILFVCHGNICRSPMAEFVLRDMCARAGLAAQFDIASAATSSEELGTPVYPPARRKLAEHGIGSYEELVERCDAVSAASIRTRESLRDAEQRIADLALLGKQIDTYRKLKPVYDRYKASKDKEKFLRGFESEIILFEAAAREIKKAGLTKLPSSEKLKTELDGLAARKTSLQTELRKVQREEKEYDTLRKNVVALLEKSKEQEWQQHRGNDLE